MPPASWALPLGHAVTLGLLQGPTEVLPVSSSAHTALLPWLAGWRYGELDAGLRKSFEVALHAGAGLALGLSMRRELTHDLAALNTRRAGALALALAPPALAGLALGGQIERRLGGPRSTAAGLLAGAAAMAAADRGGAAERGRPCAQAQPRDGLALGLAQAAALFPGVSRSGAALSAARRRGFTRASALRLSWAVGLPVFAGASLLRGARMLRTGVPEELSPVFAAGAASAFVSTLASAALVRRLRLLDRGLAPFALYRGALAAVVLARARRRRTAVESTIYPDGRNLEDACPG